MTECSDRMNNLALYAGGDLEGEAAEEMKRHLEICSHCRTEIEVLKKTIKLTKLAKGESPSPDEFISGVRKRRMILAARFRRLSIVSASVVVLAAVIAAFLIFGGIKNDNVKKFIAKSESVEVESVGYSEADVEIMPIKNKSMTIVWIISEEVESEKTR